MKIRIKYLLTLISPIIIVGVILSGCGGNGESSKVTATKHGISFSFEYPALYTGVVPQEFEDTEGDPAISILYREPGSNLPKADKHIYIRPCEPLPDREDASAWLEEHINVLELGDPKYELIDRYPAQVSGIDVEIVGYYSSVIGNLLNSNETVVWDAHLDYQGYIWKISVIAIRSYGDEARADFEVLINSFQFLN